jgi:hypothetical protein
LKRPACGEPADDLIVEMRFCHLSTLLGVLVEKMEKIGRQTCQKA